MALIGTGVGMIIVSIVGALVEIVDKRYASGYANIFSVFDMTLCLAFLLGEKKEYSRKYEF
jgi:hypothetical protein